MAYAFGLIQKINALELLNVKISIITMKIRLYNFVVYIFDLVLFIMECVHHKHAVNYIFKQENVHIFKI